MGGPSMDLYGNPLGAVRVLFERSCRNAASAAELTRSDWGVQELFQNSLFAESGHLQVIYLASGLLLHSCNVFMADHVSEVSQLSSYSFSSWTYYFDQ